MTTPPQTSAGSDLKRELGLFDAVMINAGTMIASAIFIVPATVAAAVQGTAVMTLVWVIGGIVSLLGALSVAELAAAYPEAGGQYAYLREAYGTVWAFLYGWSNFSVINTASITAIAVGFAKYIGFFTPFSESGIRIIAIVSIVGLTVLNCRGVRLGATTQNVLTTLKIGALIALIVTSFVIPGGSVSHFQPLWPSEPVGHSGWKCDTDPPGMTNEVTIKAIRAPIFSVVSTFCVVAPSRTPRQLSTVRPTIETIAMMRIPDSENGVKNPMYFANPTAIAVIDAVLMTEKFDQPYRKAHTVP